MTVFKKVNQTGVSVWCDLNEEQIADLYSLCVKASDHCELADFDGHFRHAITLISIAEFADRNKRISKSQLRIIQQYYKKNFREEIYIEGLEHFLIDIERRAERNGRYNSGLKRAEENRRRMEAMMIRKAEYDKRRLLDEIAKENESKG